MAAFVSTQVGNRLFVPAGHGKLAGGEALRGTPGTVLLLVPSPERATDWRVPRPFRAGGFTWTVRGLRAFALHPRLISAVPPAQRLVEKLMHGSLALLSFS